MLVANRHEKYIRAFTNILLILYFIITLSVFYFTLFGDRFCDFVQFWTAGELAQTDNLHSLYDVEAFKEAMCKVQSCKANITFRYPPVALLFFYPLAWFPYSLTFILWTLAGVACFWGLAKKVAPTKDAAIFVMACPALILNIMYGNNGTHNAALIGACLLLLKSRPSIAGIMAAILIYKPHMAILFPVFFLAGAHYKALKSFVVSSLTLLILTVCSFGIEPWQAFIKMLQNVGEGKYVEYASVHTIISIPHFIFSAFGNASVALMFQGVISAFLLIMLIWTSYRQRGTEDFRALLLIISILLFTPYCQIYDLAILNLAILWYLRILWNEKRLLSGSEVVSIGFWWLLPFLQITMAMTFIYHTGISFPLAVILLLHFYIVVLGEMLKVR